MIVRLRPFLFGFCSGGRPLQKSEWAESTETSIPFVIEVQMINGPATLQLVSQAAAALAGDELSGAAFQASDLKQAMFC